MEVPAHTSTTLPIFAGDILGRLFQRLGLHFSDRSSATVMIALLPGSSTCSVENHLRSIINWLKICIRCKMVSEFRIVYLIQVRSLRAFVKPFCSDFTKPSIGTSNGSEKSFHLKISRSWVTNVVSCICRSQVIWLAEGLSYANAIGSVYARR